METYDVFISYRRSGGRGAQALRRLAEEPQVGERLRPPHQVPRPLRTQVPYAVTEARYFIPDLNDTGLRDIYKPDYVDLIDSFKNRTEKIENQFFNPKDVVNKIVFYIKRNFKLDKKLEDLYDSFGLKPEYNNTYKFIEYIKNLK